MKSKILTMFNTGAVILFIGFLWIFLPHAAHAEITNNLEENHLFHIFEGLVIALTGLTLMVLSNRYDKNL